MASGGSGRASERSARFLDPAGGAHLLEEPERLLDPGPPGRLIVSDEESAVGEKRLGHLGARLDRFEDLEALPERDVRLLAASQRRQRLSEDAMCRALLELVAPELGKSEGLARRLDRPRRVAQGDVKLGDRDRGA